VAQSKLSKAVSLGFWLLVLAVLAAVVAMVTREYLQADAAHRVVARDPKLVERGRTVYETHCAACHGARLEGQPNWETRLPSGRMPAPPHDASGHTWHHPDAVLFGITKHGLVPGKYAPPGYQSDMPAFGGTLSDEEIAAVLAFIKSRWPPEIQRRQAEVDQNARAPR